MKQTVPPPWLDRDAEIPWMPGESIPPRFDVLPRRTPSLRDIGERLRKVRP